MQVNPDAFSSGQILSKLWLAEELEKVIAAEAVPGPLSVAALGGWYGMMNFILRVRDRIKIDKFVNIDQDSDACDTADQLNEPWVWQQWQFKSRCADANQVDLSEFDLVINTSTEHFQDHTWFDNIKLGTVVAIQSNDMPHDDHCGNHHSLEDVISQFPVSRLCYSGLKKFTYPNWEFTRFMIIGIK